MQPEQPKPDVSLDTLMNILGLTRHTAKALAKRGIFNKSRRGHYALNSSVQAYIQLTVASEVKTMPEAAISVDKVSVSSLAKILGITERRVQRLETESVLKKTARGRYPLSGSVQAYMIFKVQSEVSRAKRDETTPGERVKLERARKLKLENDQTESKLIALTDVLICLDATLGPLKSSLSGVPARVTNDVPLRHRIENAIEVVLNDLSKRFKKAAAALEKGSDPYPDLQDNDQMELE